MLVLELHLHLRLYSDSNLNVIVPVETYGRTDVKKPEKLRLFICFMDLAEVRMTGWIIAI